MQRVPYRSGPLTEGERMLCASADLTHLGPLPSGSVKIQLYLRTRFESMSTLHFVSFSFFFFFLSTVVMDGLTYRTSSSTSMEIFVFV